MPAWAILAQLRRIKDASAVTFMSTALLAFAMSTDAFAAALGKGMTLRRPMLSEALRTGMIFGIIETLTPLAGWAIGSMAADFVQAWDHWIAFGLLFMLGLAMIKKSTLPPTEKQDRKSVV